MPYTSRRELAANALPVFLALVAVACHPAPSEPLTPLLVPKDGISTVDLPRAHIGRESRIVLGTAPTYIVRANEPMMLPQAPELALDVPLPDAVRDHAAVAVEAWISVRDSSAVKAAKDLLSGPRITVPAAPVYLKDGDGTAPHLKFSLPDAVRGAGGRLTVRARPLPPALQQTETDPITVPADARLVFGYGLEEAAWKPGWPPVRFRVYAVPRRGEATVVFENQIDPPGRGAHRRWFDGTADLSALAGRRVTFRFETEAVGGGSAGRPVVGSLPLIANPEILARTQAPQPSRRNVILISLDTLRAESVSAYGCPEITTPTIDKRLAVAGALVRRVVTPVPFTPPAHMTMLTGLDPCTHGVLDINTALGREQRTLAEAFRAGGYETAAFTEDGYLIDGHGFERGFDSYTENRSDESASPGFAQQTFDDAMRWLASHGDRPFFLFIHTYQVHEPYAPPPQYATMFPGHDSQDTNRANRALYESEIRYTDDLVSRFLNALEARRLVDRTIIVLTSDHGEAFGEHMWGGHGLDLHDEALLVPLLFRAPGLIPAGRVVEPEVALADLPPTLLELVDLPPLPDIHGHSFAELLTGHGAPFVERPVVSWTFGDTATPMQIAVRTRGYKYLKLIESGAESLYDLGTDPGETIDRVQTAGVRLDEARAVGDEALRACGESRKRHPATSVGADAESPGWLINREEVQNREEVERKLHSLGYVQ